MRDGLKKERGRVREGGNVIKTFLGSLQLSQFASPPPLPNRNNVNLMIWIHGHALFPVWSNKMLLYMPINVSKIRFHWNQGTSYPTFLLHLWKLQRLPSLPYAAKGGFLPQFSGLWSLTNMIFGGGNPGSSIPSCRNLRAPSIISFFLSLPKHTWHNICSKILDEVWGLLFLISRKLLVLSFMAFWLRFRVSSGQGMLYDEEKS